ncbi:peptidoglycan/xylan/chitin deacetylase (PgdA/CDA1 family) [Jatrophihabitans sp. GAS493]|uniref:polysaccharide deacetylase family protein n=1 Tax=Jatrophihabitans sp. GAS493 TaxID=1907575 RepID=UPI000BC0E16C|nr:polysaccharide deacetylase family protein [Jatrophihabitans sp. GAS493]SOD74819.1 peptidoglycan/xylan/chitin deacetylase (PgdA/CDA1 family) [Jatrophihabitans sp. GAS493]
MSDRPASSAAAAGYRSPYGYSPIIERPAGHWPGGKKLAVYVALGVESYRFGDGLTENLLPSSGEPDVMNTSWRDYGNRVGAFRLLDRLAELGIPSTMLLNTDVYDEAAAVTAAARRHGSEVVGHGLSNSDSLADFAPNEELAYLRAVASRIAAEEGVPPLGWSSPWLTHTPNTLDSLVAAGYEYVLDLRMDDQPVWLSTGSRPLLTIPYALELNDSSTIIGRGASAGEFAEMIVDEFDELLLAAQEQPLVMSIVVHSFISGAPFRLRRLTRALQHLTAHSAEVWFTQPRHIYSAFRQLSPPPS